MSNAKWIWHYGEFEIYHNMKVHSRRRDYEAEYPPFWQLATVYPRINFLKQFSNEEPFTFKVHATASGSVVLDNRRYPLGSDIVAHPGAHLIKIELLNAQGLSSAYIDSDGLVTDESWVSNNAVDDNAPVGCTPAFTTLKHNPTEFPFEYRDISPVSSEDIDSGILYDFGKETFGPVKVSAPSDEEFVIRFGESHNEALDPVEAVIRYTLKGKKEYEIPAVAFRYIFVSNPSVKINAKYEYLPVKRVGSFSCDDERINKIWDVCAYTFELNTREFYFDGIKRDRWVWGGDAYQSYMIDSYLYGDNETTKRTLLSLLGKPPYHQHINTIVDYSLLTIIGAYEYYFRSGDRDFLEKIKSRLMELMDFTVSRLDDDGFICERKGDWIFIDWSDMDKSGPICAEQILLWQAYKCMNEICGCGYENRAAELQNKIWDKFWDAEKHAFIDCASSGSRHVTRHANIFAILFDFVDEEKTEEIAKHVLDNPEITKITTPYFELYELMAMGKTGRYGYILDLINSYWGGMIDLGATTIWEEFDPNMSGEEHYAMYGSAYSKSLCHAWGSGPVYLLARYCLGVYPTAPGYETYEIKPQKLFENFKGSVPIPGNRIINVECVDGEITSYISSDIH